MKSIIILLTLSLYTTSTVFSQEYNVPKNYSFADKQDYIEYTPQIVETMDWLLETPLNKDLDKRIEANTFFVQWLTGSPSVTVNLHSDIVTFINESPDLLLPFMIGWTQYQLDNGKSSDDLNPNIAGLTRSIEFYNKNKEFLNKGKEIEKYSKLLEKGKLEKDIKKKLEKITK